ncbi:MAG: hypothetical protein GY903_19005, partial [Fuerstiella sp.]|nr:hypothetical protein [Fuerstiella sp.]
MPASNGLLPSFDTDGNFSAWVAAGSHAEGDAHSGGTSGGIVYVDASGNIATDGPTVDASSNLTTTGRIVTDSGSTPSTGGESLQIEGTTATLAEFYRRGGGTNSTVVFRGGSSFCHVGVNSTGFAIGAASNLSTNWFHINSSTGYVSSGPITATASAITDTPLTVAGTAGQTADLAAIGDVTVDASSNVTSTGRFTSSGFRTSTTHYDPTRIWTNSLSYYISAAISGQTDHKIKMAQWDAAQSLYRMEIQAGDAVTYFDAPAGVEFTGSLEVSGDINFSAANPSLQRQGVDYVSLSSGLVNLGQNAQSTYLGSGAFGHYGKSWISSPSNGVMSVFAWDGSTLAEVDVGILNATAQAITDTPLSVAGAVGQTAALATFGSGARVTAAEEFSNPGSAAGSESFGAGASCTAADGLAVG